MQRSARLRLHDILEAIDGIERTVDDLTFEDYQRSWPTRRAVERGIEIISEASRHNHRVSCRSYTTPWDTISICWS